ncbi:hypothetical protein MK852_10045 [Shewanella benthica]|uniref:hypothetical protein n=1 Tax=Shewanella TaxID=22 RepID=UPI000C0D55F0|nr:MULTISPECIES: hypothetical protein [Shewanella]MBE7215570.1 hypothetical protein [Shewanella benthica]MCJ8301784.1 hypothetical protein [Shewanella sp.]MCL1062479.1 hypothetical protein [Shewanella benthica]PHQ76158.1 MAG: hypothetical protein COB74_03265 [Shewanella sp.]
MKLSLMVLALFIGLTGCADLQDAGRTIGQTTKEVTTEIGHATRDATKAIGHASRDAVKSVKADLSDEGEKNN